MMILSSKPNVVYVWMFGGWWMVRDLPRLSRKKMAISGQTRNRWLFVGISLKKRFFLTLKKRSATYTRWLADRFFGGGFKKMFLLNPKQKPFFPFLRRSKKKKPKTWLASQYFCRQNLIVIKKCFKKNNQRKLSAPTEGGPMDG